MGGRGGDATDGADGSEGRKGEAGELEVEVVGGEEGCRELHRDGTRIANGLGECRIVVQGVFVDGADSKLFVWQLFISPSG